MSITDYFSGRPHSKHGRSGLMSTSGYAKLRDPDAAGGGLGDEKIGPLGMLFLLLLVAASAFILDYGVMPPVYRPGDKTGAGDKAPYDVNARLEFTYNDPNELRQLREDAARRAPRVYTENEKWIETVLKDLKELVNIIEVSQSVGEAQDRAARFPQDRRLVEELFKYDESMGRRRKTLTTVLLERIRLSLKILSDRGILTKDDLKYERNKSGELRFIIRVAQRGDEKLEKRVNVAELLDVGDAVKDFEFGGGWKTGLSRDLATNLEAHLVFRITENLTLNKEQTRLLAEQAQESVGSGDTVVHKDQPILIKGHNIQRSDLDRLHEEWRAYRASLPVTTRAKHIAGLVTLAFSVLMIFVFVMGRTEERIFRRRRALIMLALLSLAALAGTRALMLHGYSAALSPFIFIGIVASLAFGQMVALLTVLSLAVLTAFGEIRWYSYPLELTIPTLSLSLLVGGIAAALPAANLRDRWDLLKYAGLGGLLQFAFAAGLSQLGHGTAGLPSMTDAWMALINGPVCGLLVLGSLPVIEALFGILTNIRLFELADMNQPALRRIQIESPGTFAHTLQVRNLAEPAADAIGANTRLVSAGVLYHDLGKTLKPEYFVENQMDAEERHRRLRPSVSALLITAHVKDGIELAHEYGLPQPIIDFIPEHHGTTLVSYFYHTARKDAASANASSTNGQETVQEAFFRYPGPKPQSRETALAMLADTVEAATRTLANPSPARIKAFVHELIMEKMLDGQLDECELTFADLARIEEAFLRVLVSRYHARVRYPGQEAEEPPVERRPDHKPTVTDVPPQGTQVPPPPTPKPAPASRELLTETRFLARRPSQEDPHD